VKQHTRKIIEQVLFTDPTMTQEQRAWVMDATKAKKTAERMFTVKQVAELMSVSCETVRRWHRSGKLETVSVGGQIRIPESAIPAFRT